MAVLQITDNETVQGKTDIEVQKKRRTRRQKKISQTNKNTSSSTVSDSSSSESSDSAVKKRRRRRKRRKTDNKSKLKNDTQQDETLTAEERSRFVAMDCEMVGAGYKGHKSVVARVTIIDWDGTIHFDEFVKPTCVITDYRTFVSGITPEHLEQAELDIYECREKILEILRNKILVGHALKNDLKALNINHPWHQVRDTAKYEPFMKVRFNDGILWPRKLKDLVEEKLQRRIQEEGQPHSAYEDALAAFDLYRLVRRKWEKAMDYKIKRTAEIQEVTVKNRSAQLTSSETESD